MSLAALRKLCKEKIEEYPALRLDILDCLGMAIDEIDDGGSEFNECENAASDIKQLIEDHIKAKQSKKV